jgi:hypothetical protein
MIIDIIPVWLLFFVMVGLVMFSNEIGLRLGRKVRVKRADERESPASAISAAILGLQAFMLAFTFSIVSDRYDTKKSLVREEAGVLRTVWHRADFLDEADRARSKTLLKEYVDKRIEFAQALDLDLVEGSLSRSLSIQQELWGMAVVNGRKDLNSDIGSLYVESLNEMSNLHAMRVGVGLNARIPSAIWAVLMSLLIFGMIGVGYHTAIADSRRPRVTPFLAVSFSLVIALIAALDKPGGRIVPVSQQPLINVQSEMALEK